MEGVLGPAEKISKVSVIYVYNSVCFSEPTNYTQQRATRAKTIIMSVRERKMTRTRSIAVILASNLLAVTALAQDEDAQRYTYATYFHCNVGMEDQADAMMRRDAPILDARHAVSQSQL